MVRPDAPNIELEPHLRAALDRNLCESDEVFSAIHQLHEFAVDYCELEKIVGARPFQNYPQEVQVPVSKLADFAEDVAARERSRLHLGDGPVRELRQVLENNVGVRIFSVPTASGIAGMYAFVPELGYCILLNARHPQARQRWTLAHEYGHFLADRHKPGIDYTQYSERIPSGERFADAFAMCFLMPATGLRRQYFDVTNSRDDFQVADLCGLANYYAVSVQAMTLRLESLYIHQLQSDGTTAKIAIELQSLIDGGAVHSCDPAEGAELELYVDFATQIHDGEAMALAIAKLRGWTVATDDRKAIRLAGEHSISVLTTPDVMKHWADSTDAAPEELRQALHRIEHLATFSPSSRHHLYKWWNDCTGR